MAKRKDARCNGFTKKGERCKNEAFVGKYCRLHAHQKKLSLRDNAPLVAVAISSSASLVILIEKLVKYWPDILYVLEAIRASCCDASWSGENTKPANQERLERLKSETVIGSFYQLGNIIERNDENEGSGYGGRYNKLLNRELPSSLLDALSENIELHQLNLRNLHGEEERFKSAIQEESEIYLERFIEKPRLWMYENYRYYKLYLVIESRNDFSIEFKQDENTILNSMPRAFDSFERDYPSSFCDFLQRHKEFKHWEILIDFINFLFHLDEKSYFSLNKSGDGDAFYEVRSNIKNHMTEEDVTELELVHARLCQYLEKLWSLDTRWKSLGSDLDRLSENRKWH